MTRRVGCPGHYLVLRSLQGERPPVRLQLPLPLHPRLTKHRRFHLRVTEKAFHRRRPKFARFHPAEVEDQKFFP